MIAFDRPQVEVARIDRALGDSRSQPRGGRTRWPVQREISFESGGDFMRETRREVEAYLASRSTRRAGYARLYAKVPVAIGLTAISWSLLLFGPSHLVLIAACFAGLVLGAVLTGFCVQHDANHGAFFRRTRYNHLVGWTSDALLGVSSYAWRVRHNVAHHTYTNIDGHDADITQMPVVKLVPAQPTRPWYRFQHVYVWPLYGFMGLRLQTIGDLSAFRRGTHRKQRPARAAPLGSRRVHRRQDLLRHLDAPDTAAVPPLVDRARLVRRRIARTQLHDGDGLPTGALRRGSREPVPRGASLAAADLGGPSGRVHGRLLPRQPRPDVAPRWTQLPDRASPVPTRPSHALPQDRAHRPQDGRASTTCATRFSRRSAPPSAPTDGTCGPWESRAWRSNSRWADRFRPNRPTRSSTRSTPGSGSTS